MGARGHRGPDPAGGLGESRSQDLEQTGGCEPWGVMGPPPGTTLTQVFSAHHPSDPWPGVAGPIQVVYERLGDTHRRKQPWGQVGSAVQTRAKGQATIC